MLAVISVIAFGLFAICVSALIGVYAFRLRLRTNYSLSFSLLMFANAIYALGAMAEYLSPNFELAVFWLKIVYLGSALTPFFWLLFSFAFTGNNALKKGGSFVFLLVVPLLCIGLMATNELHHLVYTSLWTMSSSPLFRLAGTRGPWFYINVIYQYALFLFGAFQIILYLPRIKGSFIGQSLTILTAAILPIIAHAALILKLTPLGFDFAPFLLSLSGLIFTWAITRYRFLNVMPVAREAVFECISDGVIVLDGINQLVDMNRAAREMLPFEFIIPVGTDASRLLSILKIDPSAERNLTEVIFTLNGKSRNFRVSTVNVREGRRRLGLAIIMNDITETREMISRLESLAETDSLTQVDNHRRFTEHAERELAQAKRRGRPITFAIMDIDHFKRVNDEYGHLAGDLALQRLCEITRQNLRAGDIFCRYGGEEFSLILIETPPRAATIVLERLRESIERMMVEFENKQIFITVSIGLCGSEVARVEDEAQLYVSRADRALYIAKGHGRNRVEALPRDAG